MNTKTTPLLPWFAAYPVRKTVSEYGIILPQLMTSKIPTMIVVTDIAPEYTEKHDLRPGDTCIFQAGLMPCRKSPDGSGKLLLDVSALVAVVQRQDQPYFRMLNGNCLLEVNYDNSRIISSISPDFLYKPSDTNREEFINECRIFKLPKEAEKYPELQEGLKAWAHHFITDPKNIFEIGGKKYSRMSYTNIFFVEGDRGEVVPVGDNILCRKSGREVLEETLASGIKLVLLHDPHKLHKLRNRAHVVKAPNGSKFKSAEGKDIYFNPGCDYPIRINGEHYFRIYERFIAAAIG
jgi:hypothetical protein